MNEARMRFEKFCRSVDATAETSHKEGRGQGRGSDGYFVPLYLPKDIPLGKRKVKQ
jgi:hypothetical protein